MVREFAAANPSIHLINVSTVRRFMRALSVLARRDKCQFLFVGTHGIVDPLGHCAGIGKSGSSYVTWRQFWDRLLQAQTPPVLWLGSCKSAHCAAAWTPLPTADPAAAWIAGFHEEIYPEEIEDILRELIKNTSTENVVYVDEEMDLLRRAVPGTSLDFYYPATFDGAKGFLQTDLFPAKTGKTFKQYLVDASCDQIPEGASEWRSPALLRLNGSRS